MKGFFTTTFIWIKLSSVCGRLTIDQIGFFSYRRHAAQQEIESQPYFSNKNKIASKTISSHDYKGFCVDDLSWRWEATRPGGVNVSALRDPEEGRQLGQYPILRTRSSSECQCRIYLANML